MKKIFQIIKKNIVGFILGVILCLVISSYAATTLASSSVYYDNSTSGGSSTTVSGALDELYNLANTSHCASVSGNTVTFKVGDYVSMTPTSTSYTTDTSMTGYTSTQTINPSELNLWRVIRINSDNTVDMVSEYASSTLVYFIGETGYKNFVGYLNTIAHQYENKCYTVDARHMGYSTQTSYITDTSALTVTTAPQTSSTSSSNVTSATEVKGLGDMGYQTDSDLVNTACGSLVASKAGTTTATSYWLASRYYDYYSSTYWVFSGRYIYTSGSVNYSGLYNYRSGSFNANRLSKAIRPIVTLKSGIKATGTGTSGDPYVLK